MAWYTWLCRLGLGLAGLALLFALTMRSRAQEEPELTLPEQIARDQQLIRAAEAEKLPALDKGRLWAQLGVHDEEAAEFVKSEEAYNRALAILENLPGAALEYAAALDNLGSLYLSEGNFDAAEKCRERAYTVREKSGDELAIARGKWMLAEVDMGKKKFKEAQRKAAEAYATMVALKDPKVSDRVSTLTLLSYASCRNNQCALGLESAREARALALRELPADHMLLGEALMALGYTQWKAGTPLEPDGPDEVMREGIRILRERATPGHPYVLGALTMYANYLRDVHRVAEANEIAEEEKALKSRTPNECANCTVSVYGLRAR
ncbi:MAG TPA: tetratricopeptide repeat protein [Edaphobacter sp.]